MPKFKKLGYYEETPVFCDKLRNINIKFVVGGGGAYRVELIEPIGENSDLGNLPKKIGEAPYHICYEVPSLDDAIDELKRDGYVVIKKPEAAIAINGRRVSFLYGRGIGLLELVESE